MLVNMGRVLKAMGSVAPLCALATVYMTPSVPTQSHLISQWLLPAHTVSEGDSPAEEAEECDSHFPLFDDDNTAPQGYKVVTTIVTCTIVPATVTVCVCLC